MNDETTAHLKRNRAIKIVVPVLILCVVAGIWLIKNLEKDNESTSTNPDFNLHVTESIDLEKLKSYGIPIIIDFGADSCIPCKEMAPVLKELNEELQGKAIIKFVDVWKDQGLSDGYPINVIPTQIFFDAEGNPYNPINPEERKMNLYSIRGSAEHVFTTHEGGIGKEDLLAILKEMGIE